MQIQINPGDVKLSEAIEQRVNDALAHLLKRFESRITRIEVHLHDENGPKHGPDKRCTMEARLAGKQPIAVHEDAVSLYDAIDGAAGKLERAVAHRVERADERAPR